MDSRKLLLLVGALIVAAITAFAARTMMAGSTTPRAVAAVKVQPDGPQVLVATRALPVGTILDPTAIKFQPWPKQLVDNAYFLEGKVNMRSLQGTVVRSAITAGQPLTQGAIVKPGDRGFLAAALGAGMRAVTLPVSAQSAVAGFVFPGDRIDLVLTQTVAGGGEGAPLRVSETVMRNLRVLATDQRTDNVADDTGKTVVKTFATVTVEATPRTAEQIAVAQQLGTISLSLRSLADNPAELAQSFASGGAKTQAAGMSTTVRLATVPEAGGSSFATGGDVSRFARRTVPAKATTCDQNGGGGAGCPPPADAGPSMRVARGSESTIVLLGAKQPTLLVASPAIAPAATPATAPVPATGTGSIPPVTVGGKQ